MNIDALLPSPAQLPWVLALIFLAVLITSLGVAAFRQPDRSGLFVFLSGLLMLPLVWTLYQLVGVTRAAAIVGA